MCIRDSKQTYGDAVEVRGCFFHLTQSTWCKVQALSIAAPYKADEDLRLFCGMLNALAFLPVADVANGTAWLRTVAPANTLELINNYELF